MISRKEIAENFKKALDKHFKNKENQYVTKVDNSEKLFDGDDTMPSFREAVLIDGIDVSKCALYNDFICASPINKKCEFCKNIPIAKCYFKQLQKQREINARLWKLLKECDVQLADMRKYLDVFMDIVNMCEEQSPSKATSYNYHVDNFAKQIFNKVWEIRNEK